MAQAIARGPLIVADHPERIRALFLEAIDLSPDDRAAFLRDRCGGDALLLGEVQSLLAQSTAGFLEGGAVRPPPRRPRAVRTSIGRYAITRELGRGGMGVVYLGRDPSLERDIAIKILPTAVTDDPERRARLVREAQLLAALNHPNIATVHSLEHVDDLLFITMEYLPGTNLGERIQKEPPDVDTALDYGRQIALALEAAHGQSIVHRDLKPANVQLLPDRRIKVLDFGLAHRASGQADDKDIAGTPGYMSPEQCTGEKVGPPSDIWAFGCVLYECLTGTRAFPATLQLHEVPAVDATRLPAETPEPIRTLIAQCLRFDPAERALDARAIRRELDDVVARRVVVRSSGPAPTRAATNLGPPLTPFIGRGAVLTEIQQLLFASRLLTITGPGGAGKTRVAYEAARQVDGFADGVWVIELASLRDPRHIALEVLSVLEVPEEPGVSPTDLLARTLGPRDALLVFDNAEHLRDACCDLIARLLDRCPALKILVTSREPLHAPSEQVFPLGPMSTPLDAPLRSMDQAEHYDAMQLFVDRARRADATLTFADEDAAVIGEICRRLDGLPLAVELAAARARVLSPNEIAERLDRALEFLSDPKSPEARHRTVRELIDWSHDQLSELEQRLFARLAVFEGTWTLEFAESLCTDDALPVHEILDTLTSLIDKSLVQCIKTEDRRGRTRYRMLDLVRQYGLERLDQTSEGKTTRVAHRDAVLDMTEEARSQLSGAKQGEWLLRLAEDHENVRQAIDFCLADNRPDLGLRIVTALDRYWMVRAHWSEASDSVHRLLDAYRESTSTRALGLHFAGLLALREVRYDAANRFLDEALAIFRAEDDRARVAAVLQTTATIRNNEGQFDDALALLEEVLVIRRALADQAGVAISLATLGRTHSRLGSSDQAHDYFEQCLTIAEELEDGYLIAAALDNLGLLDRYAGRYPSARRRFQRARDINSQLGNRAWAAKNLTHLGTVAKLEKDYRGARNHYQQSLRILEQLNDRVGRLESIRAFAHLSVDLEEFDLAARLLGAAERIAESLKLVPSDNELELVRVSGDRIHAALGAEQAETSHRAGQALTLDEASDLALRHSGSSLHPDLPPTQ